METFIRKNYINNCKLKIIIILFPSISKTTFRNFIFDTKFIRTSNYLFILIFNPELPFYFLYHPCIRQYRRRPKSKPNKFYQHVSAARSFESKRSHTCTVSHKVYLYYILRKFNFQKNIKYKTNYYILCLQSLNKK